MTFCSKRTVSRAHSLVLRVPFLDRRCSPWPLASQPNIESPQAPRNTPFLASRPNRHLPKAFHRRPKLGFPVPVRIWLRQKPYYDRIRAAFTAQAAERFFHTKELVRLLDEHFAGKRDNSRKIWTVYMFLVWYGIYFPEAA